MKQRNFELTGFEDVEKILQELYTYAQSIAYQSVLFHIFSILLEEDELGQVQEMIREAFPKAQIVGTSTNGDICDGHLAEYGMVLSVSFFEASEIEVQLFPCAQGEEHAVGEKICAAMLDAKNLCAVELLMTLKSIHGQEILKVVEGCRSDIPVFGGGSAAFRIEDNDTWVLDEKQVARQAVAMVLYRSRSLSVDVHHAIGWRPLGKNLTVTRIEGKRLYELDGVPAGRMYSKYLDIQADENFFANILEFPMMYRYNGHEVLRMPFSCRAEDESILLAADVQEGATVNFCYGDPDVIRRDVATLVETVENFGPQAVFLYSCGIRRLYWKYLLNKETGPFSKLAPVSGFYSCGEIMRMGEDLIEHHVTLIAISMREGDKECRQQAQVVEKKMKPSEDDAIHGQISMVHRLANFINVTAEELYQANMELKQLADTDELTGIYNRRMVDKIVENALVYTSQYQLPMNIAMVDIDNFKKVNDTYGHGVGDKVLQELAAIMKKEVEEITGGICGRWGGEEFLCMIPNVGIEKAVACMERVRQNIEVLARQQEYYSTVSIGVTKRHMGDSVKTIFERADGALYKAKRSGKNRVVNADADDECG
ncbi:diguanylate cyclase (GGDEF) domain-containing protein [Lachnospiraceae bacterium XBB1006]|nr:diguanylate cyclase (GGDEF) domain-containing protein [Lachnospiraceae bacterium XBB1006]